MRKLFKQTNTRSNKRINTTRHDYGILEDRRVLTALTALDAYTGQLTINLTGANDTAVVNIEAGQVTVNGSNDLDSSTAGTQSLDFEDLRSLVIETSQLRAGTHDVGNFQTIELRGDFSPTLGANLQSISIADVNSIFVIGNYVLAGDFMATMEAKGGGIDDGQFGRLDVGGTTHIDAGDNPIILDNSLNDFVGAVSLRTTDADTSVWIHDANDIEFASLMIANDIIVTALGDITDTSDSNIRVANWGSFSGANIAFGNNDSDIGTTEFFQVTLSSPGHVELYLDSSVVFTGINNMGSLDVDTDHSIQNGSKTAINVAGVATLRGAEGIRLGDRSGDIFNVGSLNFNSLGLVEITENSSMHIVGDNTARSANLSSFGDITDADDATINLEWVARFDATNVYIGDTSTDQFNAGSIQFNTDGDMFLNEDSATHIVESNQANRFELVSNGPISDAVDAIIEVATLSSFEGASATIGESDTDSFRTGWLTFNTVNRFFVYENDATNLTNLNTAATAVIVSTGAVTNSEIARVFVTDNASFSGTQITIGNRARDEMRFGGLLLNSRDSATVFEDDSTVFVGNTSVDELRMNSVGSITDATNAHINVTGAAIFFSETAGIKLGDSATDEFNAGALTLNAVNGVANVTENSDIVLAGNNQARSLVLNAQGTIEDDAFATIDLEFLLSVTATGVDLGETDTDSIGFGSLTCNTSGDTRISSQETMILTGSSVVGGELWLESEGNIFDANAQTTANSAFLTAIDIVLGDSDLDCFDVPPENLVVNASGVANVTIGDC